MFENNMYMCGDFNCSFEIASFDNCPQSRIEFVFVSSDIVNDLQNVKVRKIPVTQNNGVRLSDHIYLHFKFNLCKTQRCQGYWKMNVYHLENDDYKKLKGINDIIEKLDIFLDPISRWEMLNYQVKDFSMHFSKSFSNNAKRKIETIQKSIENIENLPSSQINMTAKKKLEKELDKLQDKAAKGAQIRSKAQLINEGERNTKFFLGLEKTNQSKNTIKCLKNSHGKYVKSNVGILMKCVLFMKICTRLRI